MDRREKRKGWYTVKRDFVFLVARHDSGGEGVFSFLGEFCCKRFIEPVSYFHAFIKHAMLCSWEG